MFTNRVYNMNEVESEVEFMNNYDIQFGRMVKYYRKLKDISQEELAQKLGYKSKSSIAKIETGAAKVPVSKVDTIAKALGVTREELLADIKIESPMIDYIDLTNNVMIEKSSTQSELHQVISLLLRLDDNELSKVHRILETFFE